MQETRETFDEILKNNNTQCVENKEEVKEGQDIHE